MAFDIEVFSWTLHSSRGRDAHATSLTSDLPDEHLKAADVGTVVERHVVPGMEDGYSIEFFDMTGQTEAVVTAPPNFDLTRARPRQQMVTRLAEPPLFDRDEIADHPQFQLIEFCFPPPLE